MATRSSRFPLTELADLARVRRYVEETAVALHAAPDAVGDMVLAMNEALTNIIIHGFAEQPGFVDVIVSCHNEDLRVCLRDRGRPFDPTARPAPDTSLPLEKRPFGGMGIHMMRVFTDEIRYRQTDSGANELLLIKYDAIRTKNSSGADGRS